VDLLRGTDDILKAMRFTPDNIRLKIVGRISDNNDSNTDWLQDLLKDPSIANKVVIYPPVPYAKVVDEIDSCDILLQPSGSNTHASRYANPLKLFDYMARGKPIVAADVPSHREILEGHNALFYRPGHPENLAHCITSL